MSSTLKERPLAKGCAYNDYLSVERREEQRDWNSGRPPRWASQSITLEMMNGSDEKLRSFARKDRANY